MSIANSEMVRLAACAAMVVGVWLVADAVNDNMGRLPVHQATHVDEAAKPTRIKAIYPVMVVTAGGRAQGEPAVDIDAAFGSAKQEGEQDERPNYAEQIRSLVRVDGVSTGGAFIGGRFYAVGSSIDALATPGTDGVGIIPKLVSSSATQVVLDVGGDVLSLSASEGGWR